MTLNKYLELYSLSQDEFAKMLGVTQGAVGHWCTGRQRISAMNAAKIERLTAGVVTGPKSYDQMSLNY